MVTYSLVTVDVFYPLKIENFNRQIWYKDCFIRNRQLLRFSLYMVFDSSLGDYSEVGSNALKIVVLFLG